MRASTSLHRNTLTHKPFYTQKLLHTHTHAHTHTQTHTHTHFCTRTLSHTDPLTHKPFYTQTLLHTNPLTQKPFDTQKLRHADPIYTQTLLHTNAYTLTLTPSYMQHQLHRNISSVFDDRPSFRAKGLLQDKSSTSKIAILPQFLTIDHHFVRRGCSRTSPAQVKSQFFLSFWPSTIISCEGVAPGQVRHKKNRNFTSVFGDRPSFRAKGLLRDKSGTSKIAILPQFLAIDPHFVRKGCSGTSPAQVKSQFYLSFWRSTLISCEKVAPGQVNSQFYFSFCRSTLISCERVAPAQVKSQFYLSFCWSTLISCERVDVSWLAAGTTLGLKRER